MPEISYPTLRTPSSHTDSGFPKRLIELRVERGMSKSNLARTVGVSSPCLANWEAGVTRPRPENLKKLSTALRTTVRFLEIGEDVGSLASDPCQKKMETVQGNLPDHKVVQEARERIATASGLDVAQITIILNFGNYGIAL